MRGIWCFFAVFALVLVLASQSAEAGYFFDSNWGAGIHVNTTSEGLNLTLAKNATGQYLQKGYFISRVLNANEIVALELFDWIENANHAFHGVGFAARQSNDSTAWGQYFNVQKNTDMPGMSRYIQYVVNLSTSNASSAPNIRMVGINYSEIMPSVSLASPAAGQRFSKGSNINFMCSANAVNNLSNITFYWNYKGHWIANSTKSVSGRGNSSTFSRLNLSNGTFVWNCLAFDKTGKHAWAATNRSVVVFVPAVDASPPQISHTLSTRKIINGSQVTMHVEATDDVNVSKVWAVIDYPGTGEDKLWLNNHADNTYRLRRLGRHNVTIYANDTSGKKVNVSDYFISVAPITFSVNVTNYNSTGISSELLIYEPNTTTQVDSFSAGNGRFSGKTVANGTYDMRFSAYAGRFLVSLENVRIWQNTGRRVIMDKRPSPVSGFQLTYAAESNYAFSRAKISLIYNSSDFANESYIGLYVCHEWNFSSRVCTGNWTRMANATVNKANNRVDAYVSGFSGFSLKQESYCGDGVCSSNENSTRCPSDCRCSTGETRSCSLSHLGRCATGNEFCSSGVWGGCPQPLTETCNQVDDNCDGKVDNVGGGNSVEATKCGCYNGASPASEVFDGIDNDCNGHIDDGCVCNESETRTCGNSTGECRPGTKACINCKWSVCQGAVGPFAEVCGNGKDDDCDGQYDEVGCIMNSSISCGYGPITSAECKCGTASYASGNCCDGIYQVEPCPGFPWWILVVVGVAIIAAALAYHFLSRGGKGKEKQWENLEKRYTPAKM